MKNILIVFLVCVLCFLTNGCGVPGQETLNSIARPNMNFIDSQVDNWYIFHNDRIYVYLFENGKDVFFSTDLNGNDKKIINQSEDVRLAEMYLIFDNYAYYYTTFYQGIKKINLDTGEVFNVIDNIYLYMIPDTLENGKVVVEYENDNSDDAHVYIATLDLKSGDLSNETVLPLVGFYTYYYSIKYNKTFFLDSDSDNYNYLYEGNSVIYKYPSTINNKDLVFVQDDYVFLVTSDQIIKLDINDYSVIDKKDSHNSDYRIYTSIRDRSRQYKDGELTAPVCTLERPYFYIKDDGTYKFNSKTMEFVKISNIEDIGYSFVQQVDNFVIFSGQVNTTIYNKQTGSSTTYSSSNFSVDDNNIYLMTFIGDFYYQESSFCKFKVEKYAKTLN